MKIFRLSIAALSILFCGVLSISHAQDRDTSSSVRERFRERWLKQQRDLPAPEISTERDINKPGDYTASIVHNGLTRFYRLHIPSGYSAANPTPLVVALHGGGGNMDFQATDKYYGLISKSDKEGFIVVFPNGYSELRSGKFATWNAGTCCGPARDEKVDDAGFIRLIVNTLAGQLNVDPRRIFATGMSNGGMMAYRLACEMPEMFKAVSAVAGTDSMITCNPKSPVSILHIHARDDDHVLFGGGAGPNAFKDASKITNFTSVPDTIARWVKLNSCNPTPKRVLEKPDATCEVYSSCKDKVEVQLCVTATGGHSWPGGMRVKGGEPASSALSAADVMWDFFKNK